MDGGAVFDIAGEVPNCGFIHSFLARLRYLRQLYPRAQRHDVTSHPSAYAAFLYLYSSARASVKGVSGKVESGLEYLCALPVVCESVKASLRSNLPARCVRILEAYAVTHVVY